MRTSRFQLSNTAAQPVTPRTIFVAISWLSRQPACLSLKCCCKLFREYRLTVSYSMFLNHTHSYMIRARMLERTQAQMRHTSRNREWVYTVKKNTRLKWSADQPIFLSSHSFGGEVVRHTLLVSFHSYLSYDARKGKYSAKSVDFAKSIHVAEEFIRRSHVCGTFMHVSAECIVE